MSFIGAVTGFSGQHPSRPPQETQPPQDPPSSDPSGSDAPPVDESSGASGAGDAQGGASGGSAGGGANEGGLVATDEPIPYVAEPTVTRDTVAAEAARSARDGDAQLETAFKVDASDDARARRFAEAAQDREATAALIAAIQPPPENAPSLRDDVEAVRSLAKRDAEAATAA